MLKCNICDFNHAYILVKGNITIAGNIAARAAFKKCATFTKCTTKTDGTMVDDAEDHANVQSDRSYFKLF